LSNLPARQQFNGAQLEVIKRSCAKGTTDDEFNAFLEFSRARGLNPLIRQIYVQVYNADKPDKRQIVIVTAIDGYRAIGERTGNYRPDDEEPRIVYDPDLIGPNNPKGVVSATVSVYKFSHGGWHKVPAIARWEEYAPVKELWDDNNPTGRKAPTGKFELDRKKDQWVRGGGVAQLTKCAEALALRKAFPDAFSGLYTAEEMDKADTQDMTPSAALEAHERAERLEKLGGANALMIDWLDGKELARVPFDKFFSQVDQWIEAQVRAEEFSTIDVFRGRNRHALTEFWAHRKNDALELRRKMNAAAEKAKAVPAEEQ
jgi:phage recombination protein Bet